MTPNGGASLHTALYAYLNAQLALDYVTGRAARTRALPFGVIREYEREGDDDLTNRKEVITVYLDVWAEDHGTAQTHVDALTDLFDPRDKAKLLDLSAYSLAHYGTRILQADVSYAEDPDAPEEQAYRGIVVLEFLIIAT